MAAHQIFQIRFNVCMYVLGKLRNQVYHHISEEKLSRQLFELEFTAIPLKFDKQFPPQKSCTVFGIIYNMLIYQVKPQR